jgi:hypothetical protein
VHPAWLEPLAEWPEVKDVALHLINVGEMSDFDREWVRALSEATGWDEDDIVDDLKDTTVDPSLRAAKYAQLFNKYYSASMEHYNSGDLEQAGEKLYAAVLALIKYDAARRGTPIAHWSYGKVASYVSNNASREVREDLSMLLKTVHELHEFFYEGCPDQTTCRNDIDVALTLLKRLTGKLLSG